MRDRARLDAQAAGCRERRRLRFILAQIDDPRLQPRRARRWRRTDARGWEMKKKSLAALAEYSPNRRLNLAFAVSQD